MQKVNIKPPISSNGNMLKENNMDNIFILIFFIAVIYMVAQILLIENNGEIK